MALFKLSKTEGANLLTLEGAFSTARDAFAEAAQQIADEWQEAFDGRSESWQQGEAGTAAQERIAALAGLATDLQEFFVDLPDFVGEEAG